MYRPRLVLVVRCFVLCTRYWFGMDFSMDASDGSLVRWYYTNPDTNSDTYTDSNTDSYAYAHADTNSKLCVQPIQGRHSQHQLEYRCDAKHRWWFDASHHHCHAFA